MHSERRGTDNTFQTKDKTPGQKPPRTIEREFVQGAFVRDFVLDLQKIGVKGNPRCVTYTFGGLGKCDKV